MTPSKPSGKYVTNCWYAAAWTSEVTDRPFKRQLLDERVVMFRDGDGKVAALIDRCPHRLAPLSMGECVNGHIRCGYHGMEFDRDGQCVNIPGQSIIPPTAIARSFPVAERFNLVWLWMGDKALADEALLPGVRKHGAPGWAVIDQGYQLHAANFRIEIENLMDPAHTTFLHKQTVGNPAAKDEPINVKRVNENGENGIVAYRWLENTQPSPMDRQAMSFSGEAKVDRAQFFCFFLPSISLVEIVSMPSGLEHTDENMDKGLRTFSYKFLTPETEGSTHFFWLHVRNYRLGDTEWEQSLRVNLDKTYMEDNEMASAIQIEQEKTGVRQLTAIAIDRAPVMAIREVERMISAERSLAEAASGELLPVD
ncbi:MAG: aromatic ring-hydroxylating dioxygenase subunit alpha [Caulobacteraceae bacterium]